MKMNRLGLESTSEGQRYLQTIADRVNGAQIAFSNQNVGPKAASPSRFSPN